MTNKASVLTLRLPFELKHRIELLAEKQGVSINQLAMYAFTKEVAALEAADFFLKKWKGKNKKSILNAFDKVTAKIGRKKVPNWDKM